MVAAALFRSLASKMSRASRTHHSPLLARGSVGSAGSLPPPASNEQEGLRSLATKMARAPHHRLLHERGLHSRTSPNSGASGSTPLSTSNKDLGARSSEYVSFSRTSRLVKATAAVAYITIFGSAIYMAGWVKPGVEKLVDNVNVLSIERLILKDKILAIEHGCQRLNVLAEDVLANVCEAQSMQSSGHGKEAAGAKEKGTREVTKVHCQENHVKELQAGIKDLQAEITELRIFLEPARSERKV